METFFIIAGVLLVGVLAYGVAKKLCHWYDCGALKRNWKKREPNSNDYNLHTTNKLSEYDRYLTDVNDWRLEGEKEVKENGPDDC